MQYTPEDEAADLEQLRWALDEGNIEALLAAALQAEEDAKTALDLAEIIDALGDDD